MFGGYGGIIHSIEGNPTLVFVFASSIHFLFISSYWLLPILLKTELKSGCSPPTPTLLLSRPACSRGVRGCLCPDGEVLGSRLTNNPSGQRQPLTPREQAGRDRRGVGIGGLQPC
ncbi:hypothetical protein GQ457_11G027430 [Hibiscus cannabinus]